MNKQNAVLQSSARKTVKAKLQMQLGFYYCSHYMAECDVQKCALYLFDKLEFGGESPRTMRARLVSNRYCPDPLGIVTAEQFVKLEFSNPF